MTDGERYILWDWLRRLTEHEAAFDWQELDEVADYLRANGEGRRNSSPGTIRRTCST